MADEVSQRVLLERRMTIGSDTATVTREGERIKISYGWAGRLTREGDDFFVDDIRKLARFVFDTDEAAPDDPELDELLRRYEARKEAMRQHRARRWWVKWLIVITLIVVALNFLIPGGLFNG